ncbi:DNA mismatch repair endonuclease MutL [Caproiciproducens galactitolivorans]|uniref:DNA mismatch repair protein MutL n=1 Tax=Caproiciproducens galactitolivorans TaxID=642589 RepID=A0A4Z0YH36_9FIRM|nr:DNA mismatch repair endonuclease MutL [Caproiciproducens galactitolivorans]QEY34183.1 DNA mismatch repair endonuclease MutL [Caproiciproducens galactitolivorans]TGJ78063.1 DNA mismatch repair protein MutL [Caproiciproducens galactitolivorans]
MGIINVLDKHVAELIAAGEVVERPASVVKELVENAVDAGASAVTVEIKNGGITYMRVTDNGSGIFRDDVAVSFLRHATSKVHSQDDLDTISTLGFRGEALASIAAVSHVEMLTRTKDELAGTRYVIDGGVEQICEDAGCAQGTTIVVRDLFYNTPARMKFLKKDVVEANAIASILDRIALSHPEVSLRFLRDGKETLHTPGDGKLKSAIYAVYGKEFTSGLIPVDYELNGVALSGFVSKPSAARPNRSMQQFFINGRYVKSRTAMVALEEAFKGFIMVGKVPACVLHLKIAFHAVDVNVHPTKIEVRFMNEKPVFDVVYHGVKTALNQGDTPNVMTLPKPAVPAFEQPKAPVQMEWGIKPPVRPFQKTEESSRRLAVSDVQVPLYNTLFKVKKIEAPEPAPAEPASNMPAVQKADEIPVEPKAPPAEEISPKPKKPGKLVGEAFSTYILVQRGEDELVFIDKHAAHERMLYEKLKAEGGQAVQQMLLKPVTVTLEKNEYAAILESLSLCAEAGFEIEDFGSGTVLVRSAPMILEEDVASAVMEIAGYLQNAKNDIMTEKLNWLYHNIACRAAVKAGNESSPQELAALVQRLEDEDIRYCPHGRPAYIIMKKKDLERQFGRIQ